MANIKFKVAMAIGCNNTERTEAFELYRQALGATLLHHSIPPDGGDIYMLISIGGTEVLLTPAASTADSINNLMTCEVHFETETDLRHAYDVLCREGRDASLQGPYPWAKILALVTDKFGIDWALYYNP